jgi:hypothetical protein
MFFKFRVARVVQHGGLEKVQHFAVIALLAAHTARI